jgi:hypothetical protein
MKALTRLVFSVSVMVNLPIRFVEYLWERGGPLIVLNFNEERIRGLGQQFCIIRYTRRLILHCWFFGGPICKRARQGVP